ncbi:hypothetical protein [Pseudoalteromonas sp. Of7M-16]|uniref:hypothetical protein n=1 Tax=Pseudoalteromonas sp. Of7M-16 TaxID=2917756 RepID=UPI001EF57587|nr:hypothetical protein [Pseudoalteromonas sp. Of7M-16]MCG7551589.1 hypothetical protein [Pseudoalteromonas sp. Of7M-16]
MSKAKKFKEWFKTRMGHSAHLKLAHSAILELEYLCAEKDKEIERLIKNNTKRN